MNNELIIQSLTNKLSKDPNFAYCSMSVQTNINKKPLLNVYWYDYAGRWDSLESWCEVPVFHFTTYWTREERLDKPRWKID